MKLDRKKMLLISFMLFSLFFGAGNLIFPPFLGQNAGSSTVSAMLGFLATAVILPVLGVIVVARFDGLEQLAQHAGKKFSLIFTVLIYLSIGPGLGQMDYRPLMQLAKRRNLPMTLENTNPQNAVSARRTLEKTLEEC